MGVVAKALACAGCALVSGAAGLALWVQQSAAEDPAKVAAIFPWSKAAVHVLIDEAIASPDRNVVRTLALEDRLLAINPLDERPFLNSVRPVEDPAASHREALRRNPRNLQARIHVAQDAIAHGDLTSAFVQVGRLHAIARGEPQLAQEAGRLVARAPGGAQALAPFIAANDPWAVDLLRSLNTSDFDLGRLARLNQAAPSSDGSFVTRLLKERGVEVAFIAWLDLLPPESTRHVSWPFDAEFFGSAASPPFNWKVDPASTDFLKGGGLYATYNGRGSPVLASQLMLLQPASYRLSVRMTGQIGERGSGFSWDLECFSGDKPLGSIRISELDDRPRELHVDFAVPEDCAAQRLLLRGLPGEFPVRPRSTTMSIAITARSGEP